MQASTSDDLPPLSNDDIEILYEIVTTAQSLPGPPFHALYDAYDTVFARHGLTPNHDRIYIRFLFHMQKGYSREGGDLFTRFQAQLARLGIEIEIDREGDAVEDITRNLGRNGLNGHASALQERRAPSRRASFNSMYDATHHSDQDNTAAARRRLSAYGNDVERPSSRATYQGVSGRARSHSRSRVLPPFPVRGRVKKRAVSDNLSYRPKRSGSVSSKGSLRIKRDRQDPLSQLHDEYSADESAGSISPLRKPHSNPAEHHVLPDFLYRPSEAQMMEDAETYLYNRSRTSVHRYFLKWRDAASQIREDEENLELRAISFNRTWTIRRAINEWQSRHQARRQEVETKRFWNRQEKIAGRTYNLYLLSKAFTHWAEVTSEEIRRTTEARRHILRTKYFKAWRDITTVNELKVRRVGLRKFFGLWRKRNVVIREQNVHALAIYQESLVCRHYQRWSWQFFERRAPWWYAGRLKKSFFLRWASITRLLKEREAYVEHIRGHDVQRKTLRKWSAKTTAIRELEPLRTDFRTKALLSTAFNSLRSQAQLKPMIAPMSQQVDKRVLRSALQTWHLQTKLSRQAALTDRQRIMRNALIAWNDRLRCRVLTSRINDRILLQVLNKWLLESRAALFIRVRKTRQKRSIFTQWKTKAQNQRQRLDTAEQNFTIDRTVRLLRGCFTNLRDATRFRQTQSALALSLYEPKIARRTFYTILDSYDHIAQMNQDAERASYYVTAKSAMRLWRNAARHSCVQREEQETLARRIQRREAYVQVRRKTKVGLTKRMLGKWRDCAAQLGVQERQAAEMRENWIWQEATALFAGWHGRSRDLLAFEHQAKQFRDQQLCKQNFATWVVRNRYIQDLEIRALTFQAESQAVSATSCLKKLRWRVFQLQRHEENAIALQRRNWEKHVRAMVRFWSEQVRDREAVRAVSPSPRPGRRDGEAYIEEAAAYGFEAEMDGESIAHAENLTAFDEGEFLVGADLDLSLSFSPSGPAAASTGLRPSTGNRKLSQQEFDEEPIDPEPETEPERPLLTSTPGYLRTPSKRNTAKALARGRLLGASVGGSSFLGGIAPFNVAFGAASAPPDSRGGHANAETGPGAIMSFERRLRAQGISGHGGLAVRTRGTGHVGFEDITEEGT